MGGCTCCGASVAEWLERAIAVREFSGSNPGRGEHKENLCGHRGPSNYVSFRRAVKRQRLYTLNSHDKAKNNTTTQQHSLQTPYTLELDLGLFLPDVARSFPPE